MVTRSRLDADDISTCSSASSSTYTGAVNKRFPVRPGIAWRKGERLEAMDFSSKWSEFIIISDVNTSKWSEFIIISDVNTSKWSECIIISDLSTDLAQFHGTVFGFVLFYSFTNLFFRISNFFSLSTTEETRLVEMRIWCIKIGIVLVLHLNSSKCMVRVFNLKSQ
jgi:hypothetical protein